MTEHDPFSPPQEEQTEEKPSSGKLRLLQDNEEFKLHEVAPGLHHFAIGLGWDFKPFDGQPVDLDACCFLLNAKDMTREDEDFVFYNNLSSRCGNVRLSGDDRTGVSGGDDETIFVNLKDLAMDVVKIVFVISIYDAPERKQSFARLGDLRIRLSTEEDSREIARYVVSGEEFGAAEAITIGELSRLGNEWTFHASAQTVQGGLGAIATHYGMVIV